MKVNGQEIEPESLNIEFRDEKPYITTAPLPEYILVHKDFWDVAEEWSAVDGDTGIAPPATYLWREALGHADEDVANDGYVLHFDTTNVVAAYKLLADESDQKVLQLVSWTER